MPALHKTNRDHHRRYSSSSSSSSRPREREHKSYKHEKWQKRSRSRSVSHHQRNDRDKNYYNQHHAEPQRYHPRAYEPRKEVEYRRRGQEDDKRERIEDRQNQDKYGQKRDYGPPHHRASSKDKERTDYRRKQRSEHKRWKSSSSGSSNSSSSSSSSSSSRPRRHQPKPIYVKRQPKKSDNHIKQFDKPAELKKQQPEIIKEKPYGKEKVVEQFRPPERPREIPGQKMTMIPPPPPPPFRKTNDFNQGQDYSRNRKEERPVFRREDKSGYHRQEVRREEKREYKVEDHRQEKVLNKTHEQFKRDERQHITEQKREDYHNKHHISQQYHDPSTRVEPVPKFQHHYSSKSEQVKNWSPIKRNLEQRKDYKKQSDVPQISKKQVSKFDIMMNQARTNLLYSPPPINFMVLDVFRNMNKFEIQALDERWSSSIQNQLDKESNIKTRLPDLSTETNTEIEPRLWTYVKDERNEEQIDLKLRMEELRLRNNSIADLTRKLKVLQ